MGHPGFFSISDFSTICLATEIQSGKVPFLASLNHFGPKSDIPAQIWHQCFHDNAAVVFVFKHVEKNMWCDVHVMKSYRLREVRFAPKLVKIGLESQNVVNIDIKKSQICPIKSVWLFIIIFFSCNLFCFLLLFFFQFYRDKIDFFLDKIVIKKKRILRTYDTQLPSQVYISASINPEDYQTYIFVPSFRLRTTYEDEVSFSCCVNTARNITYLIRRRDATMFSQH